MASGIIMFTMGAWKMLLDRRYDKNTFVSFMDDFLPDFLPNERKVRTPKTSLLKTIELLGTSKDCNVSVLSAYCDSANAGKRIGITQSAFKMLSEHQIRNALIAFHNGGGQWRFSLLTSALEPVEGGIVTKTGNPKRHSYLLGAGAKTDVPRKFLIEQGRVADIGALRERFSFEIVNKQFFESIDVLFTKLVGGERGGKKYSGLLKIRGVASNSPEHQTFAVRLIGRIVFCWFLKEKKSLSGVSLIPAELLSKDAAGEQRDYYRNTLEPLFFEILNKRRKDRPIELQTERYNCVPYLNGGLFSPKRDDYYAYAPATGGNGGVIPKIPNEWFVELFDVFSQYNFTIDENTSYDVDLSVDPEMLGRIFENLLAEINPETGENARKSTGSFYTPREIVEYMADSSLTRFLTDRTSVAEEKIRALVNYSKENDRDHALTNDEKRAVVDALGDLKILDPACGSGAFPIGILQKTVFILQQVDEGADIWFEKQLSATPSVELQREIEVRHKSGNYDYLRKLGVIRASIFGVDIQAIAVDIAKLRCFLTLIIDDRIDDEADNRGILPLPNLNFKFVAANSLIALPDIAQNTQGVKAFDIVIANPPYVGEKGHKPLFDTLKKSPSGKKYYNGKMDLFYFFFHVALDMLADNGVLAFITTNYYPTADGAVKLRNDLYARTNIIELINFNEFKIFESAVGQHNMITIARKTANPDDDFISRQTFVDTKGGPNGDELSGFLNRRMNGAHYTETTKASLYDGKKKYIRFTAGGPETDAILSRMSKIGKEIGKICRVNQGIITGADKFTSAHARKYPDIFAVRNEGIFVFQKGELNAAIGDDGIIKPWFKNSDIGRYWSSSFNEKELLYTNGEYPLSDSGVEYLQKFKPILIARREFINGKRPWYELHWGRSASIFDSRKIIAPQRSRENTFAYNDIPWYGSADIYYITEKPNDKINLKMLLGVLNSRLMFLWLYNRGKRKGEMLELYETPLSEIPIVLPDAKTEKRIDALVSAIIEKKREERNADTVELEGRIDNIVCDLYGIDEGGRIIINEFWRRKH
jgi:type I restriction-modification system DNA methylase subunit